MSTCLHPAGHFHSNFLGDRCSTCKEAGRTRARGRGMNQVLFQRWTDGDEDAFRSLYQVYYRRILHFATALVGNPAEGEDLAQEVFARLYAGRQEYQREGISNGRALLYTIARRLAYRYTSYRRRWEQMATQQGVIRELMHTEASTPEELLEAAERGAYIQEAVDCLPEPQREIILLRHREDLSYEEMAQVLHCSVSQVKARLHYARKLLKARLKKMRIVRGP